MGCWAEEEAARCLSGMSFCGNCSFCIISARELRSHCRRQISPYRCYRWFQQRLWPGTGLVSCQRHQCSALSVTLMWPVVEGSSYTSDNNRASQMRKTHISESKQCEQGRLQSSVYLNRGSASSVACSVHRYEIPRIIFNTFQQSTGKRICPLTAQTHVDVAKNVWLSPVLVTAL